MSKKLLYLDMDGVISDFDKSIEALCPRILEQSYDERYDKVNELCEANPDIFHHLHPIEGAIEATKKLLKLYDVYFLSTPMWNVPDSFTGKRIWLGKYFGDTVEKRLILTHRKDLNVGHYLVDDTKRNGAGEFSGIHIHFGSEQFPNWKVTLPYLEQPAVTGNLTSQQTTA